MPAINQFENENYSRIARVHARQYKPHPKLTPWGYERLLPSESGRSARDIDIRKLGTLDIGVYTQHSNENKEVSTTSALIRIIKKQVIWLPTRVIWLPTRVIWLPTRVILEGVK